MTRLFIAGLKLLPKDFHFLVKFSYLFEFGEWHFTHLKKGARFFRTEGVFYGFWWNTLGNKRISAKDVPEFLEGNALLNFGAVSPDPPTSSATVIEGYESLDLL